MKPHLSLCLIISYINTVLGGSGNESNLSDLYSPFIDLFPPQSPSEIPPTFLLYSRKDPLNAEKLDWNDTKAVIKLKQFNGSRRTKVLVHGFLDSPAIGFWMHEMKKRWLSYRNLNVIIVDWSLGNRFPYGQAAANAKVVGAMVAVQIEQLCNLRDSTLDKFHILGQSLGAHLAGFAGKFLQGRLGQITGLDPAGPAFVNVSKWSRLDPSDAQFVDVIHTDSNRLGKWDASGHVDIYPNGGLKQPGCDGWDRWNAFLNKGALRGTRKLMACDHTRAADYYIEAIKNMTNPASKPAIAYQCDNYEDFQQGKCATCRPNRSKCLYFGPRAIEFKKRKVSGKRFFIDLVLDENLY